jgi:HSP20 family protein
MLTRWTEFDRSFTLLDEFQRRMNRLFSELGAGYWPEQSFRTYGYGLWPAANLYDTGKDLMVKAELPGMSEKDIQITCNQDGLTISGERKVDVPEGYSVHRQEREQVKFSRSFSFPCKVDLEKATATMKNGMLSVTLPKAPEAQPRQITVKAR